MIKKQGYDGVELPIFELDPKHGQGRQVARRSRQAYGGLPRRR
jgi:hypothetical protein